MHACNGLAWCIRPGTIANKTIKKKCKTKFDKPVDIHSRRLSGHSAKPWCHDQLPSSNCRNNRLLLAHQFDSPNSALSDATYGNGRLGNLKLFLDATKKAGVRESNLFSNLDFIDGKALKTVDNCLKGSALLRVACLAPGTSLPVRKIRSLCLRAAPFSSCTLWPSERPAPSRA